jgi:hypothetical protein
MQDYGRTQLSEFPADSARLSAIMSSFGSIELYSATLVTLDHSVQGQQM